MSHGGKFPPHWLQERDAQGHRAAGGTELRVGLITSYAQGTEPAAVHQCPVLVMRFGHSSIFSSIAEASGY